MASFTIKNIPPKLYSTLKQRAHLNHRSINGEIIAILEQVCTHQATTPDEILRKARDLRRLTAGPAKKASDIQWAKESGRP